MRSIVNKLSFSLIIATTFIVLSLSAKAQSNPPTLPCANGQPGGPPSPPYCPIGGQTDPINVFSLDEYRVDRDLQVWGSVGQAPLEWVRYAHSRTTPGQQWFGQGHNWRHNYQWELSYSGTSPNAQVQLNYPDGSQYYFFQSTATQWNSQVGCKDILYQSGTDLYLQRQNGFVYHFAYHTDPTYYWLNGYLMTDFSDSQGNSTNLTYDSSNRLTTITEPGGRSLTIHYSTYSISLRAGGLLSYITSAPTPNAWNEIDLSWNPGPARYLRYVGPDGGYCDIAELQFYDSSNNLISGTPFGTGPAGASGTDYTKAFDGDTTTYTDMADPSGGYVGLDLGPSSTEAVAKIKYFPRASYADRMAPASNNTFGEFLLDSIFPASITAISEVDCSDGRSVVYNYTGYNDSTMPYNYEVLSSVNYDDGTQATYTYSQTEPSTPPLITAWHDPRFIGGPLFNSKTVYWPVSIAGAVQYQEGSDGTMIAGTGVLGGNIENPAFTYGNGGIDSYLFNTGATPYGLVASHTDTLNHTSSYLYDSYGFVNSITDARGNATTYTNSIYGNPLSIAYPDGTSESWTRDSRDLPLTHTNQRGYTTTWTRDSFHRPTQIAYPDGTSETFTYNSLGEVLTHGLRNGGSESFTYGSTGLMTSKVDAASETWTYTYDTFSRLASVTDPNSHTTSYAYNLKGLITQITYADSSNKTYTYDDYGNKLTETNEIGKTTTFTYDLYQRNVTITDPLNRTTQINYGLLSGAGCGSCHTQSNITRITLPSGKATTYTYDTEWNKLTQTVGYGTADAATTTYSYDSNYNVIGTTDPRCNAWSCSFDSRNRKLTATDPLNHSSNYSYDGVGNILSVTRSDGGVTNNTFDAMNRLTSSKDPKNQTTSFTYDGGDSLQTLTDADGHAYTYSYDYLERKLGLSYPDGSSENCSYDAAGNLYTYTTRAGAVETDSYDSRNRLTSTSWSDSTPGESYSYDAAGRTETLNNSACNLSYSYDAANQMLSETQAISGATSHTVSYTYDADGNKSTLTYPDGTALSYGYTNRNQISSISGSTSTLASYTYDLNGNRTAKNLANSVNTSLSYDTANRLTSMANVTGSTALSQYAYGYDNVNRRTYEQRNGSLGDAYGYDAVDQVTGVKYNASNVATSPTIPSRTVAYDFDFVGNWTSLADSTTGTTSLTANNLNQYTAVGSNSPTYDGNGNLHTFSGWTYTYDSKNRLISATNGAISMQLSYDGRNRCVKRVMGEGTTVYFFDSWSLLEERSSSDTQLEKYVQGGMIDEIINKVDSAATVYYVYNALGNATALTNAAGAFVEQYCYDIYGQPTFTDGSGSPLTATSYNNRFLFTGREFLSVLNLYDFRNRFYSPSVGRFLQTDPIKDHIFTWLAESPMKMAAASQGANIYSYAKNSPLDNYDHLGTCPECCVGQARAVQNAVYKLANEFIAVDAANGVLFRSTVPGLQNISPNVIPVGRGGTGFNNPNVPMSPNEPEYNAMTLGPNGAGLFFDEEILGIENSILQALAAYNACRAAATPGCLYDQAQGLINDAYNEIQKLRP